MKLSTLYAWASISMPIFGCILSMISHRYAYMQMTSLLAILFLIAAVKFYKDESR